MKRVMQTVMITVGLFLLFSLFVFGSYNVEASQRINRYKTMTVFSTMSWWFENVKKEDVSWKVADKSILTVSSDGTFNAKKCGTTIVTASFKGRYNDFLIQVEVVPMEHHEKEIAEYIKTGKNSDNISGDELRAAKRIKNSIKRIIKPGMNRQEKIKAVYEEIAMRNEYTSGKKTDSDYSIVGPMLEGKSVCSGYSRTFLTYMLALDIPCRFISGWSLEDDGTKRGSHAWNLVKCDDEKWYHLDLTWDDKDRNTDQLYDELEFDYFLLTDKEIQKDHKWAKKEYPSCNGKKYSKWHIELDEENYYQQFPDYYVVADHNEAIDYIIDMADQGYNEIKLIYDENTPITEDDWNEIYDFTSVYNHHSHWNSYKNYYRYDINLYY